MKKLFAATLATVTLALPLHLWRVIYPASDWAALFLAALAAALFIVMYKISASLHRAKLNIAVLATSTYSKFLTGRLHAVITATAFIIVVLPVLAWQALTATIVEVAGLFILSVVAGSCSLAARIWLQRHLTPLFARSAGIKIGTIIPTIIFIPLLAWINWNYVAYSGEMRTANLSQAITFGINELPPRRGWIAEILSAFYAMDGAKLWLLLQSGSPRWVTILFSLDSALAGFAVSASSSILSLFVTDLTDRADR